MSIIQMKLLASKNAKKISFSVRIARPVWNKAKSVTEFRTVPTTRTRVITVSNVQKGLLHALISSSTNEHSATKITPRAVS